jgi:glycosyltransferase involved in cell wall biosynthesis
MSKIKILKASPFYDHYLDQFYRARPQLKDCSYNDQYQAIMADCFGWYDVWKTTLEATGDYEFVEVISNAELLQKQWALEHQVNFRPDHWRLDILEQQILEFQPDIFFSHDFGTIDAEFRNLIRKKCPSIKTVLAWDGIAANDSKLFNGCDIVLSFNDDTVKYYQDHGFRSELFHFGFNEKILEKVQRRDALYDLSFCGTVSSGWHSERLDFLYNISKQFKVDLWTNPLPVTVRSIGGALARLNTKSLSDLIKLKSLSKINHGQIFGLEMFQVLADSKISLNKHIDLVGKNAGNMRLFEAAGMGSCLLTDYKSNLSDIFDLDKELVTYQTTDEAIDKIKYLLNNETERRAIALAGQKKVLEKYSITKQIKLAAAFIIN